MVDVMSNSSFFQEYLRVWLLFQLLNFLAKTGQKLLESGAGDRFLGFQPEGPKEDHTCRETLYPRFFSPCFCLTKATCLQSYLLQKRCLNCLFICAYVCTRNLFLSAKFVFEKVLWKKNATTTNPACIENASRCFMSGTTAFSWTDFTMNFGDKNVGLAVSFGSINKRQQTRTLENPMVRGSIYLNPNHNQYSSTTTSKHPDPFVH